MCRQAMAIQARLVPLHDAMFVESNPGPVKYAASLLGFGTNTVPAAAGAGERGDGARRCGRDGGSGAAAIDGRAPEEQDRLYLARHRLAEPQGAVRL